jgi:hypothetical protein
MTTYSDKFTCIFTKSVCYFCFILTKIGMWREILVENNERVISPKYIQWELRCLMRTDEQTDRHGRSNSRSSQLSWDIIWTVLVYLNKSSIGFTLNATSPVPHFVPFVSCFHSADPAGSTEIYCSIHCSLFPLFVAAETHCFTAHEKKNNSVPVP